MAFLEGVAWVKWFLGKGQLAGEKVESVAEALMMMLRFIIWHSKVP